MFPKRKRVLFLLSIFIVIFLGLLSLSKNNKAYLKGEIVVWAEDKYYSYFLKIAKEFKNSNKKVNIKIVNIDENEYLSKLQTTDKKELPNIVELNFLEINKIKDDFNFFEENKDIIETYKKNFSNARLQEVEAHNNYYGIPFESNPMALYVRSDILEKYGYGAEDINTWSQLLNIGINIKNKTSGEINIFSSKDRDNIYCLMLAQLINNEDNSKSVDDILNEINNIYKQEYITEDNNYLFRIDSLDYYSYLISEDFEGKWICENPPSFRIGENRLYDLGGDNLVALNVNKNTELVKEFIAYAATNKELLSKELLEGNFFPSSLYALKGKYVERDDKNIEGTSPFLTLMNIVERAPGMNNYSGFQEKIVEIDNN